MATGTLLTFQEFEKYQDDQNKHELLRGEHLIVPPPKFDHTRVQQHLQDALRQYVREHRLGEVYTEAGFKLSSNTWLRPDVSFVRTKQSQMVSRGGYLEGSPALAIEVASDSNTAAQLDMKIELYFAHGAEEVSVVYPRTQHVRVHFPNGHSETLTSELHSPLFPGWSAPLSAVLND